MLMFMRFIMAISKEKSLQICKSVTQVHSHIFIPIYTGAVMLLWCGCLREPVFSFDLDVQGQSYYNFGQTGQNLLHSEPLDTRHGVFK